jgi:hypothetical protein
MAAMNRGSERFRIESRPSTLSLRRKTRTFVASLLTGGLTGLSPNWPPVDVVLLDTGTGEVVKRWQEYGSEAAELMKTLTDDLASMTLGDFMEKWDVPGLDP